jgi:putative ABC transport system ATP-binding protein
LKMLSLNNAFHRYDASTTVKLPELQANKGDRLLITGLSGSGKSTLLHVLAGVLNPTGGSLVINNTEIYSLSESRRDRFRGRNIGVIYQQLHLIETLTVEENIRLAQYMAGMAEDRSRVRRLCGELGIEDKLSAYPGQLSQGQKQRVSIARAVVNEPALLLADEPTSSLDDLRSEDVVNLLIQMAEKTGATLVISTHDGRVKKHFGNVVNLNLPMEEVA